jgi:hypothetical protein
MRTLVLGVLLLVSSGLADAQKSIRQVDFKNFTYPLSGPTLGHDRLRWLDMSTKRHIRLVSGQDTTGSPGFTLESVLIADVTGEGQEQAVVVLHYRTGGTQQTDYVYIYSFADGKPKLLAYFHSGDRGSSGLYKVYGENGKLVVELFDPEKRSGDCRSEGFVRTRYKWLNGRFEAFGARESGALVTEDHPQEP